MSPSLLPCWSSYGPMHVRAATVRERWRLNRSLTVAARTAPLASSLEYRGPFAYNVALETPAGAPGREASDVRRILADLTFPHGCRGAAVRHPRRRSAGPAA